jgi:GT2 family glycosyltransferase
MSEIEDPGNVSGPGAVFRDGNKTAAPFDEEIYLRLNADVRQAVASGTFRSGRDHYDRYGRKEGRPFQVPETVVRDRIFTAGNPDAGGLATPPAASVDTVKISHSGGIFLVGWVNDTLDRLDSVDLYFSSWSISFDSKSLARLRRPDAEAAVGKGAEHAYGFWGFLYGARRLTAGGCSVVLRLKSGLEVSYRIIAEAIEDDALRTIALTHLAHTQYFGNAYFEAVATIDNSIGEQLVDFNKMLSRRAVNGPYVERFGRSGRRYKGSIVVCLYGRPEYMFLQSAMFSRQPGMQDYEFIYVCNSPHIAEPLLKEARQCALIYGLDMSVIILNSNGGFGAANNVAAQYASSDRLLVMNPDVFPHDAAWVLKHSALLDALPAAQTDLFGAPLYYDDGSLMHAGMYFCNDTVPSFEKGRKREINLLRVEHYGKGAPPETAQFVKPRPVPAVTGAFISVATAWFEKLEGFTQDYVFGHYEDADLCLKSIAAGRLPWLHDVRLWHLEGKGSHRQPQHEGGSTVNRWLFTKSWGEAVLQDLLGPEPAHAGFQTETPKPDAPKLAKRGRV